MPEICCSVLIRCAKQHRGSATVMMRVRGGQGERHIHPLSTEVDLCIKFSQAQGRGLWINNNIFIFSGYSVISDRYLDIHIAANS